MAVRSEGEFELVLGNRQLFSVLGIVVILLGIFFAMGFFAGKSVGQASAGSSTASRRSVDQNPLVVDSPQGAPPATATAPPASAEPEPAAPATDSSVEKTDKPAASEKKESAPVRPPASKSPDQVVTPANGSYLQVASTRLSEAQSLAALLRKHQFHVVLAESSKPELVRVLVGPFSSPEATTEARAKLKSLDIANVIPRKFPVKD